MVGLVQGRADRRLLDAQRRRRRRVGPAEADAGHADRRRRWSRSALAVAHVPRRCRRVWPIYVLAALGAAVGAFDLPARQALVPTLVPREHLPNAISLNTIMLQVASVGRAVGRRPAHRGGRRRLGVRRQRRLVRRRDRRAADDARRAGAPERPRPGRADDVSLHAALEGLRFVFRSPLIRSTMLLDFFATFFSSATALLPIFAQDILHVGAKGYGWLYAAPAVGALVTSAVDGAADRPHRPARRRRCCGPWPATASRRSSSASRDRSG